MTYNVSSGTLNLTYSLTDYKTALQCTMIEPDAAVVCIVLLFDSLSVTAASFQGGEVAVAPLNFSLSENFLLDGKVSSKKNTKFGAGNPTLGDLI